jgi:hypothetical protein
MQVIITAIAPRNQRVRVVLETEQRRLVTIAGNKTSMLRDFNMPVTITFDTAK